MAYNPKYRVLAGGYRGDFDLPLTGLLEFLQNPKFRPDPAWHATCIEVYALENGKLGEKVAVLAVPEKS
jgi:hypothetical protein